MVADIKVHSFTKHDQPKSSNEITDRKIDLLTKIKHLELQLRYRKKRQYQQT